MSYIRGEVYVWATDKDIWYCRAEHLSSKPFPEEGHYFDFAWSVDEHGLPCPTTNYDLFVAHSAEEMLAHVRIHIEQYESLVNRLRGAEKELLGDE